MAPMMPASGPLRSCDTAWSSVSLTSFISRSPLDTSCSRSTRSRWATRVSFSVASSTANAMNTAKRPSAFQYGTRSWLGPGPVRSANRVATVQISAVPIPARRPRFHVTRPMGIR